MIKLLFHLFVRSLEIPKLTLLINERNILRIARNRATPKPSRTYVKSLLQKYTDEYWRVEISEDGNTAIYTNKMLLDPPRGYVFTEGEI